MQYRILAVSLLLSACGAGSAGDDEHDADATAGISDTIHETLDEASAVEDALMENKKRIDAALDDAAGHD